MVAKLHKTGSGEIANEDSGSNNQPRRSKSFRNKPSWLLCAIADLDDRMKKLMNRQHKENADGFAARANSYYHERPQLFELLDDLYNAYLSLADRYCQALSKNHKQTSRCSSPIPPPRFDEATETKGDNNKNVEELHSDAESSLSYQSPPIKAKPKTIDADTILAELIMKAVEYEIAQDEAEAAEKRLGESCRKMDLQKNLLDVLESERLILLNDNAALGYRVAALAEENKGLVSETQFMKRKAAELARCVLKTREDHRVCMLSKKIEDLQGQIYGLEKRNKEYYDQLVKQNEKGENGGGDSKKVRDGKEVSLEDCLHGGGGGVGGGAVFPGLGKCFSFSLKGFGDQNAKVESGRGLKLWDKVRKFELFNCSPDI